jgi:hypothetical protein
MWLGLRTLLPPRKKRSPSEEVDLRMLFFWFLCMVVRGLSKLVGEVFWKPCGSSMEPSVNLVVKALVMNTLS